MDSFRVFALPELSVRDRDILNGSALMNKVSENLFRNPTAFRFYEEYFGVEFENRSWVVFSGKTPILMLPALCRSGELNFAGMPAEMVSIVTGDDKYQATRALIRGLRVAAKSHGAIKGTFAHDSTLARELHSSIVGTDLEYVGMVDLSLREDLRWSVLRKSYRSLINWGKRNLRTQVIDKFNNDYSQFLEFKNLHLKVCDRKTRSDLTWHYQFEMIKEGSGYLVNVFYKEELVSGCFVMNDSSNALYAVAASDRDLMATGLGLNHCSLWRAISVAADKGCEQFILGDVKEGDDHQEKTRNIAMFKRGFATDINIIPSISCVLFE